MRRGGLLSNEKDDAQAAITANSSGQPEAIGKALPTGARIAEFEVIRVLGEGGFGIVYLAFDQLLHRHVAIKEYFPSSYAVRHDTQAITALSPNHVETYRAGMASFIEEARLLARFEHPALLKVLRYWEANGTAYMVMPHYQGRTLRELLKMPDEFSTEIELRALMGPLLDAVAVLHDEQCFHRDISPENIIIRPNDAPVLLDFGAARRILGDLHGGADRRAEAELRADRAILRRRLARARTVDRHLRAGRGHVHRDHAQAAAIRRRARVPGSGEAARESGAGGILVAVPARDRRRHGGEAGRSPAHDCGVQGSAGPRQAASANGLRRPPAPPPKPAPVVNAAPHRPHRPPSSPP